MASERIKSGRGKVGKGGLRCDCCGGQGHRRYHRNKHWARKLVRHIRKVDKRQAINDGLFDE